MRQDGVDLEVKRFLLYLARWQLSGVVLAPVLALMTGEPIFELTIIKATIVANLLGGAVFYWLDKLIFGGTKR